MKQKQIALLLQQRIFPKAAPGKRSEQELDPYKNKVRNWFSKAETCKRYKIRALKKVNDWTYIMPKTNNKYKVWTN